MFCSGLAIQPVERQGSSLLFRHLPSHQLPVVGPTTRLYFRQPARNALSRFRIFRLFIHNFNSRQSACGPSLLLHTLKSHGMGQPGRGFLPLG